MQAGLMECFKAVGTLQYVKIGTGYLIFIITILSFTKWLRWNDMFLKCIYILLVIASMGIFGKYIIWNTYTASIANKCSYCSLYQKCFPENSSPLLWKVCGEMFHFIYQYSFFTFPSFVIGTLVAAVFLNIYQRIPVNLATALTAGICLPLCICGVFPLVKGLMGNRDIKGYVILSFLFITPMISPYIIFLSFFVLGAEYLIARFVCAVLIAIAGGIIISRFSEFKRKREAIYTEIKQGVGGHMDVNLAKNPDANESRKKPNLLEYGLFYFKSIGRYVLMGIVAGSLLATFIPPQFIDKYISRTLSGLFLMVLTAIPVNMCSGQEIIILKPLQMLGLSIGHQISFTIAATGICLSVIPLYYATFGKRLTGIIVSYFFISSLCIGYLTNLAIRILA